MRQHSSKVLITGASGFIGQALYKVLTTAGYEVVACVRENKNHRQTKKIPYAKNPIISSLYSIKQKNQWHSILNGICVVIHLATTSQDSTVNLLDVKSVKNLDQQAVKQGQIGRLFFL